MDKVYSHRRILVAYAAEFLVVSVDFLIIVRIKSERQMRFVFSQLIFLGMVAHPCQFKSEIAGRGREVVDYEIAFFVNNLSAFVEIEGLFIEFERSFKIGHIDIVVVEVTFYFHIYNFRIHLEYVYF